MISHFDHTYAFLADNNLEATLARFERAGFSLWPERVKHAAGIETGFVAFSNCFLEFTTVFDEAAFAKDATEAEKQTRSNPRIIGVGAVASDPLSVEKKIRAFFPSMKKTYVRYADDNPTEAVWTYCPMPIEANPGIHVFAYRAHRRHDKPTELRMGPNTIFGLTGLVFCSPEGELRRNTWAKYYRALLPGFAETSTGFRTKSQTFEWISPSQYEEIFGEPWHQKQGLYYDTAAVKLGAQDPVKVAAMLENEGFKCRWIKPGIQFVTQRDSNTGNAFLIERDNAENFVAHLANP